MASVAHPGGRHHEEFCEYGDCRAYATGGIRLNVCDYHARIMFEDCMAAGRYLPDPITPVPNGPRGVGSIYAVRFADRIKIGFTSRGESRLRELPHDEVLLLIGGYTMKDEQAIHKKLEPHRITGEWYADVPQVRDVVAFLQAA